MNRTITETAFKIARGVLTTPPHMWHQRWRDRNLSDATSRDDYLERPAVYNGQELLIGGLEIMQDWEHPVMEAMAKVAARDKGSVLEVGFGMGISATCLMEAGCSHYTIIEPHPDVIKTCEEWSKTQPAPVTIVQGFWEDVIDDLGLFDGILFDTYPITEEENKVNTLLRQFIPYAAAHLKPGGVFTFYGGEPDVLPDEDMELLGSLFSEVSIEYATGLKPPQDCQYYKHDRMLVPICVK